MNGPTLVILMYHGFFRVMEENSCAHLLADYMTTHERFAQQLDQLLALRDRRRLTFIHPRDFFALHDAPKDHLYVYLTFDDGYRSVLPACARLRREGVPAAIFINSGLMERGESAWPEKFACFAEFLGRRGLELLVGRSRYVICSGADIQERVEAVRAIRAGLKTVPTEMREGILEELYRTHGFGPGDAAGTALHGDLQLLDWEEVRDLDASGFVIGGHTLTHPILTQCGPERLINEITEDKKFIESRLRHPITDFAIPNGRAVDYDDAVLECCDRAGYDTVYAAVRGATGLADVGRPLSRFNAGTPIFDLSSTLERLSMPCSPSGEFGELEPGSTG